MNTPLTLTPAAEERLADILIDSDSKYVRVFVQGGGCSGFSYGFTLDDELNEDDYEIHFTRYERTYSVLADAMSMQYLVGASIDYKETLLSNSFVVDNPNAQTTCGCGSSFSI